MKENTTIAKSEEKRAELRKILNRYYSVEFQLKETGTLYHFKLRDIASNSLGILVNEDSAVLEFLKVNDTLKMKYYPPDASGSAEFLKTQIIHITKKEGESFKGHFLIGLSILEKQTLDDNSSLTR
jgi:hypothetical protein